MGDILIPKSAGNEDVWDRLGGRARYCYDFPVVTAVSPGGGGHCGGLELDIADDFKNRFPLSLELSFLDTESKLFNSTFADGTTSAGSRMGGQIGFGHLTRRGSLFNDSGDYTARFSTGAIPMIGFGPSSVSPSDRSLGGDTFSFGETGERAFNVSTRYVALGEWRPSGRGPAFYIGPELVFGTQYAGEYSPFNRLNLDLRLTVGLGFSDASVRGNNGGDRELGDVAISQALYAAVHNALMRYTMAKTLSDPQGEIGSGSSGGERGPFVNVPPLLAASATMSALSSPLTPALHGGEDWFWVFAGANALVGATSFAYDSPSASAAGTADMLNLARLMAYPAAGISSPSSRRRHASSVDEREAYINLAASLLNSVVTVVGAEGGSSAAAHGGVSANLSIAGSPDPTGGKLVERTDYSLIPCSAVSGSQNGNRAGFRVHKSWRDLPSRDIQLFSAVTLLSPQFLGGNVGNHLSGQNNQYSSDSQLNTDLDAVIGLEWKTPFTRLSLGLGNKAIYGGPETAKAGIGVATGFDVIIPFNRHKGRDDGSGVTFGVRGTAHAILPDGGSQTEVYPHVGVTIANF